LKKLGFSQFTVEDTNKLLWWWQHSGKQQMTLAKDNVEKSKVFKNMAAHLEEKYKSRTYLITCLHILQSLTLKLKL